jgi:hypothetical protein
MWFHPINILLKDVSYHGFAQCGLYISLKHIVEPLQTPFAKASKPSDVLILDLLDYMIRKH